jgi:3-hydroxymyristoyl/3-hydroxydecanoyl-(acyl carrier protein) dehydratase
VILDSGEIQKILRQRPPFLLVDRVLELHDEYIVGTKSVKAGEPSLAGHFPDEPLFPGVLLVEAASQLGGILMAKDAAFANTGAGYLAKIDNFKFMRFIRPGEEIVMTAKKQKSFGSLARVSVTASVDGEPAGEGVVTYFLRQKETAANEA